MWTNIRKVKFSKMRILKMFVTAVCVVFLIKLRWPKRKSLYDTSGKVIAVHFRVLS